MRIKMKTFQEYLEEGKDTIVLEILFEKEDFEKFKKDYSTELYKEKITMIDAFDLKKNKVRVVLRGNSWYLSKNKFAKAIEKVYKGAIA